MIKFYPIIGKPMVKFYPIIRHSPPGMPYGFFFFFFFFILPPPRFPDDNFWPPSRTVPEFWPVTGHGHRKKCIDFRPRATPGWGVGPPKHPPPPFFVCVSEPQEHFWKKKNCREKIFFCVLKPQERFKTPWTLMPPPSPQNTHLNPRAIINNPTIAVWTRSAIKKRRGWCLVKMNVQLLTQFLLEVCQLIRP